MSAQKLEEQLVKQDKFKELLNKIYGVLKTAGYRKESFNFRLFEEDGLCKIISFQRNKWNMDESLEFIINIGIYFREDKKLISPKFKQYECIIRKRMDDKGKYWKIDSNTDIDEMFQRIEKELGKILKWFEHFESRVVVIRMILNGTADQYSDTEILNYQTAKMLADMGFAEEVYDRIKDIWSASFIELSNEICGRN